MHHTEECEDNQGATTMITGMLVFGAGLSIRRNVFYAALIVSAASAAAAAAPGDLQQASALCNAAVPSWVVSEQGSWGTNNGLSISGFEAAGQPIPYLVETVQWLSIETNGTAMGLFNCPPAERVASGPINSTAPDDALPLNTSSLSPWKDPALEHSEFFFGTFTRSLTPPTLTSDLFDPTPITATPFAFSRGPLPPPHAGSFTIIDDSPPAPATVGSGNPARP